MSESIIQIPLELWWARCCSQFPREPVPKATQPLGEEPFMMANLNCVQWVHVSGNVSVHLAPVSPWESAAAAEESMLGAKLWRAAVLHNATQLAKCRLEGTWDSLSNCTFWRAVSKSRFPRPGSSCDFSITGDGCSTTSLHNLCQCLTTLTVKNSVFLCSDEIACILIHASHPVTENYCECLSDFLSFIPSHQVFICIENISPPHSTSPCMETV